MAIKYRDISSGMIKVKNVSSQRLFYFPFQLFVMDGHHNLDRSSPNNQCQYMPAISPKILISYDSMCMQ